MAKEKPLTATTLLFSLCFALPLSGNAASLYNISDLGPLKLSGYDEQNLRIKINDNNTVIGWHRKAFTNNSPVMAFTWDSINGFQTPLSANSEQAIYAINSNNVSVGFAIDNTGKKNAASWNTDYSAQTDLSNLGGNYSVATSINSSSQIVGSSEDSAGTVQPVSWLNNDIAIIPINNPQGGTADLINDNSWVAGSINMSGNLQQAFLWDGAALSILSNINNDVSASWVSGINNLNQTVGGMQIFQVPGSTSQRDIRTHGFVWSKTAGLTDLGQKINGVSWANSTNENQQIVGGRLYNLLNREAILWEDSTAFNLNKLVQNIADWTLHDATDINNYGNIVGIGKRGGLHHAFLLEPIGGSATTSDLEITLSTINTNNKPRALSVNATDTVQSLNFSVTNHGPDPASNIQIESGVDNLLSIVSFEIDKGNCSILDNNISCTIPSMELDETIDLLVTLNTEQTDTYKIEVQVAANEIDAGANANNTVSKSIKVLARELNQQAPITDQSTSTGSTDTTNPVDTVSDSGTNQTISSSSNSGGGCSLGNNQSLDPIFYFLLLISILKISRNRAGKHV